MGKVRTMDGKLEAVTGAVPEVLSPVSWRRAFVRIIEKRRTHQKENSRVLIIVALTAASAPFVSVALHAIFRF